MQLTGCHVNLVRTIFGTAIGSSTLFSSYNYYTLDTVSIICMHVHYFVCEQLYIECGFVFWEFPDDQSQ